MQFRIAPSFTIHQEEFLYSRYHISEILIFIFLYREIFVCLFLVKVPRNKQATVFQPVSAIDNLFISANIC